MTFVVGCDEPPGAPSVEVEDAGAQGVDARTVPALEASQPNEADARHDLDVRVDAASASPRFDAEAEPDLDPDGTTCFGLVDALPACAPQQCVPARFHVVSDGSSPRMLDCSGPCDGAWPAPGTAPDQELLAYRLKATGDYELFVQLNFDRKLAGATTAEQARAALSDPLFQFNSRLDPARGPGLQSIDYGTYGPLEIVAFDGHRMRLRGQGEVSFLRGPHVDDPHVCGSSDNPFALPSICETSACTYAAATANGSGAAAVLELDVTLDLF